MSKPPRPSPEHVAALAVRGQAIAARAHELMAGAMREALDATGGLPDVAPESRRDVVEYLTRRGRMTPDEAALLLGAAGAGSRAAVERAPAKAGAAAPPVGSDQIG